jgi:DNA-directed RNA polymerase specialized sigma54-like protein
MWKYSIDVFIVESEDEEGIVKAGTYLTLKKGTVKDLDEVSKALKAIAQINPSGVLTLELEKVKEIPVVKHTTTAPALGSEFYGENLSNAPTNEDKTQASPSEIPATAKVETVKETVPKSVKK